MTRYDIDCSRNETFQLTVDFTDSTGAAIPLSTVNGETVLTIRPQDNSSSTALINLSTSTTSLPTNSAASVGTFWFPAGYTNRFVVYLPEETLDPNTGHASWRAVEERQRYYYDLIATRPATPSTPKTKTKLLYGYFTLLSGISDP